MFVVLDSSGSDGGNGNWAYSGFDVTDANWHHIVAVKDSNHIRLHVDGQETQRVPKSYPSGFEAPTMLNIGYLNLSGHYRYDGDLDEVAIYSRALTPRRLQSIGTPVRASGIAVMTPMVTE